MTIVKKVFASTAFSLEQKNELLEATLAGDQSDMAENCRATCEASLPDPAVKERIWQQLNDPANKDSNYVRDAKMAGFY